MQINFKFIFICISLLYVTPPKIDCNIAGVNLSLNRKSVNEWKENCMGYLNNYLENLTLPDSSNSFGNQFPIGEVHGNLRNSKFKFKGLSSKELFLSLHEPNILTVKIHRLKGEGNIDSDLRYLIFHNEAEVFVKFHRLDFVANLTLNRTFFGGGVIPNISISSLIPELDFDFNVTGSVLDDLVIIMYKMFKKLVKNIIINVFKPIVMGFMEQEMNQIVNSVYPPYQPVINNSQTPLSMNTSLYSDIICKPGYMVFPMDSTAYMQNFNQTLNPPYKINQSLEEFITDFSDGQMILSEYFFNSLVYSFFVSRQINVTIQSTSINLQPYLNLNSDLVNDIFPGIEELYGKIRDFNLILKSDYSKPAPTVQIKDGKLTGVAPAVLELQIILEDNIIATPLVLNILVNFTATLEYGAKKNIVYLNPEKLLCVESKMVKSLLKTIPDECDIRFFVNFVLRFANNLAIKKAVKQTLQFTVPNLTFVNVTEVKVKTFTKYAVIGFKPIWLKFWENTNS